MNSDNDFLIDFYISHRGASALAPENTIAAMELAKSYGSTWIEVDVRFSRDMELIVFHDNNFKRIAKLNCPVLDKNYNDLKKFDVGFWFDRSFMGERIPTLLEVIKFCNHNNINLNIEIKAERDFAYFIGKKVQKTVEKFWLPGKSLLISSFDLKPLTQIKETKKIKKMILLEKFPKKKYIDKDLSKFIYLGLSLNIVDKDSVKYLLNLGKKVLVYTVNDPLKAIELKSWGITSIFTDFPKNFIEINKD